MAYSLPIDVAPGLGGALWPVTFVVIQVVTNIYYHRAWLYHILGARWLVSGLPKTPISRPHASRHEVASGL